MLTALRLPTRALGLVTGVAVLVVVGAPAAHAAPAPVPGLAASLAPLGVELTWTASGTGTPIVRDVTGLATADYPTGRLVPAGSTADCPAATCAVDTGFTNTASQTYAVWATDADGSSSAEATLTVDPMAPAGTAVVLDVPASTVLADHGVALTGHVTRDGAPFAGAQVQLRSSVLGSSTADTLGTLTSTADGTVWTSVVPTRSRSYWLVLPADAWSAGSTSGTQVVRLQPRGVTAVRPGTIAWRQTAVVSGAFAPVLAGSTVAVQRWSGSAWVTIAYRVLSATSGWSVGVAPPVGTQRYRAVLGAAPSHLGAVSGVASLVVVPRTLYQGLCGPDVLALQRRLVALRYDVGAVNGCFGYDLRHAVTAFQKVQRLPRTGRWTGVERTRALHPVVFVPRYRTSGLSAEVDVTRQVLVLARDGVVVRVVDVSTGSDQVYYQDGVRQVAHTPRGAFRVYFKVDGMRIAPLGALWRPSFFYRGFAVHGSASVPPYPASHGCVRITDSAANRLFSTLVIGLRLFVYDE